MAVILTTYLTRKGDPQKKTNSLPDDPEKMKYFKDIEAVIFYDSLSLEFRNKYPKITWVRALDYPWSANDGRFWIYKNYLLKHPEIEQVFLVDLFDTRINSIPIIPKGKIFIQSEPLVNPETGVNGTWVSNRRWIQNCFKRCYQCEPRGFLMGKPVLNAGLMGGDRDVVLNLLELICEEFKRMNVKDKNCNMLVLNRIVYDRIQPDRIVTGFPYHSVFKGYEDRTDVNFNHK